MKNANGLAPMYWLREGPLECVSVKAVKMRTGSKDGSVTKFHFPIPTVFSSNARRLWGEGEVYRPGELYAGILLCLLVP